MAMHKETGFVEAINLYYTERP